MRFICTEDHGDNLPALIQRIMVAYYVDREFGGGKLAKQRSQALKLSADKLYKEAGQLRKEAQNILKPRRT